MAEFKINSLQEFYTLDIDPDNDRVIIRDSKNRILIESPLENPQYGGLYAAFNANTVVGLGGAQLLTRGPISSGNLQSSFLPGFCGRITTPGYSGSLTTTSGGGIDTSPLMRFSEQWQELIVVDDAIVETNNYRDTVEVYPIVPNSSEIRNTTEETRIPILTNLLASDFRSLVSYRDEYQFTVSLDREIYDAVGLLVNVFSSQDIFVDRLITYGNILASQSTGEFSEKQGILFDDRRGNDFLDLPIPNKYVHEFDTGIFNENTSILTLDNPVVDRDVYFLRNSVSYQSQSMTEYQVEVNFEELGSPITVAEFVDQLEALPFWGQTVYTRIPLSNINEPTGPPFSISAGQFNFSNETLYVQNSSLDFGRIQGISSTPVDNSSDNFEYKKINERIPINKPAYLCRSKENGLFDVYSCLCSFLDGLDNLPETIQQDSLLPSPPTLSYSTMTLYNVQLIHADLKFWPHGVEGKDTFAVRNWEAMGCKKADSVLYSDKERITRVFSDLNGNIE